MRKAIVALACTIASSCSNNTSHVPIEVRTLPPATASPVPTASPAPTSTPIAYSGSIAPDSRTTKNAGDPLVLGAPLFPAMGLPYGTATLTIAPAPASTPAIVWTVSSASFMVNPNPQTSLALPPPVDGTSIGGSNPGRATLTATVAPPYELTATLPVYFYLSTDIGCDMRANAGQAFDAGNVFVQGSDSPAHSDMYETAPENSGSNDTCANGAFATGPGTANVYHFPYGATLVTDGGVANAPVVSGVRHAPLFSYQQASLWRNDFTSMNAATLEAKQTSCVSLCGSVILFKTAGGRIVKMDVFENDEYSLLALYEVSDANDTFPF